MNVKKMFLVIVAVFSMVALFGVNAYAGAWYTCRVELTGPGGGRIFINLSDTDAIPDFANRWFIAYYPGQEKEMLATALAAMSNNMPVLTYLDSTNAYSSILRLYMVTESATGSAMDGGRDLGIMDMPEPAR